MNAAIVLTTIRVPELLVEYADNLEKYGHKNVEFLVIGDLKTPQEASEEIVRRIRERDFDAEYLDIRKQKQLLSEFPQLKKMVPWNSDCRRNLGYLIASRHGAEVIVSIDDDNFVGDEDYLKAHSLIGTAVRMKAPSSENRWFNPCSLLETQPKLRIHPRGFPYCRRRSSYTTWSQDEGRVVLNMGLWLDHPDVDAVTNLTESIRVTGLKSEQVMLSPGTFAPINTQNTAFHRDILPAYYYIPMGVPIHGMTLGRYGDVWSGFFAKKAIDKMNDRVTFGRPLTIHRRNAHDLIKDLESEFWGILITEYLTKFLESTQLEGGSYGKVYADLADRLDMADVYPDKTVQKYFSKVARNMKMWVDICERL